MSVALLTHGWVCYCNRTIINKYIVPYTLDIKNKCNIGLQIIDKTKVNLNAIDMLDKQLNLKINESQINIKNSDDQVNIKKEC